MAEDTIPTYENDTLEERLKSWEKEKKGLIGDLQSEREKRHELESRLAQVENSLTSAADENGEVRPEEKVNRLAQDPDQYIDTRLQEQINPIYQKLQQMELDRKFDRAYSWLAKQEKVDPDEIRGSDIEKDLARIVKDHQMQSMDPVEGTRAAYKIYLQEKQEKGTREENREAAINGQSTETVRNPVRTGKFRFTRSGLAKMTQEQFNTNYAAIKEAEANNLIYDDIKDNR